ncbi:MAG: glutamate formimidoyltransferase [Chloroflexota bacterium]
MPNPIIECIPNFSEARRKDVVEKILTAITSVPGVTLLDQHSDSDHNRTVVTFIGPPEAVEEAAFRSIQKAAELIDTNEHRGSHPRLGAADVVPFVPISAVTMDECVTLARRLGKRVGKELGIPVYLYEQAALRPDRVNLEDVRRGQYEALKDEIGVKPERNPDFGPARLGPAGATIIGARAPLIAYNVYLDSKDIEVAKAIAKAIRQSSGGLAAVKALGMLVDGKAQVSMNLTDFRQTSIHTVMEAIRKEAARHYVTIARSELVGLLPQEALTDVAVRHLQLEGFGLEQILEQRMQAGGPEECPDPRTRFLDELAAGTPAPGGGSAAAYSGAMAAALVAMVARLTIGKKNYALVEPQMKQILKQAEGIRRILTRAVEEDAKAFETVMAAFKLPKTTARQDTTRNKAIEKATLAATKVPLNVAEQAVRLLELAEKCVTLGNLNAITDGASGAALAHASLLAAGYNVRINVANLNDRDAGDRFLIRLQALEEQAGELDGKIRAAIRERAGIE